MVLVRTTRLFLKCNTRATFSHEQRGCLSQLIKLTVLIVNGFALAFEAQKRKDWYERMKGVVG